MKTTAKIGMAVSVFMIGVALKVGVGSRAERTLVATPMFHDFGPVNKGSKLTCNFKMENLSNMDVAIIDVVSSCGCTGATAAKGQRIAVGEMYNLPVSLKVGSESGQIVSTVKVIYQYQSNPSFVPHVLKLKVYALVEDLVPGQRQSAEIGRGGSRRDMTDQPPRKEATMSDNERLATEPDHLAVFRLTESPDRHSPGWLDE